MGIFKNILAKKQRAISASIGEYFKGKPQRVDVNLPLGLKLNGMARLDETKFVIYGDALKMASPGAGNHTVIAVEKFTINALTVYRFYLESNDDKNQSILQIPLSGAPISAPISASISAPISAPSPPEVSGIILYRVVDEVYPENEEDWGLWLNEGTGWIGYKDFIIRDDDGTETLYYRVWGADEDYVGPISFQSTMVLDPYGMTGMKTENLGMVYAREISAEGTGANLREYVFLTQEKVLDDDGGVEEAKIVIMVGMDLDKAEVEVFG